MKLVKFSDGTYGVRVRFSIFNFKWEFLDLNNSRFCLNRTDHFFEHHCKGPRELAEKKIKDKCDKHIIVKE